jgi:hypothetical protein
MGNKEPSVAEPVVVANGKKDSRVMLGPVLDVRAAAGGSWQKRNNLPGAAFISAFVCPDGQIHDLPLCIGEAIEPLSATLGVPFAASLIAITATAQ